MRSIDDAMAVHQSSKKRIDELDDDVIEEKDVKIELGPFDEVVAAAPAEQNQT